MSEPDRSAPAALPFLARICRNLLGDGVDWLACDLVDGRHAYDEDAPRWQSTTRIEPGADVKALAAKKRADLTAMRARDLARRAPKDGAST